MGCPCQLWCRGADAKPSTNVQVSSTNVFHSRWLPLLLILPVARSIKYSFELAQPRPLCPPDGISMRRYHPAIMAALRAQMR